MKIPAKIQKIIQDQSYVTDKTGMSGAGVYIFSDMVLKIQKKSCESENEVTMMRWLNGKIPTPNIIEHTNENGYSYILMNKCTGMMACDPYFMEKPLKQIDLLAEALRHLWSVPIDDCPCRLPLQKRLDMAQENVSKGCIDMRCVDADTFGPNGFRDPEALLNWLVENAPDETQMLCHGDFCLPNIFLTETSLSGLIDLGRAGVSDPWMDIALCCRSLENNYNGIYNGKPYIGYKMQMLFDALEIKLDQERIRYYILLDELF